MPAVIFGLNQVRKERLFLLRCRWFLISAGILFSLNSYTQNLKCKKIATGKKITLDSMFIEPGSVSSVAEFTYDPITRSILVKEDADSVLVCYRVLSPSFNEPIFRRSIQTYDSSIVISRREPSQVVLEESTLFDFPGITKFGSITRGISFGNRQNLFINSNLNLQIDGQLDKNLFISAVITDQNIPYQPEGNTQQIRDFDNVFIKLYNDNFDLTAGDIVLQQGVSSGYFMRYLKNIQGIQGSLYQRKGDLKSTTSASAAVSKGKFHSAQITPIDGVSGPYRLRGREGERFIIVLANSEKVFLDGKLLRRGFDQDYIIDYNLGEITFSNRVIITQFSILRVDFEYAEQSYSRSNFSVNQLFEGEKGSFHVDYYRESDNPDAELGFTLSDQDLSDLRSQGDQEMLGFISSLDTVSFNANQIQYIQKDTIDLDGNVQTIFAFTERFASEVFSPSFSEVEQGQGDYVLVNSTANGRVYRWVSPQNGQKQGNFQPGQSISLANRRQLLTVGGSLQISPFETVKTDIAVSETDLNLYSDLDDNDNVGLAYYLSFESKDRPSPIQDYKLVAGLEMEFDQQNFTFIDRYRPILFDRTWGSEAAFTNTSQDLIVNARIGLSRNNANQFVYRSNRRERGDQVDGWLHDLSWNQEIGQFKFSSNHSYLINDREALEDRWLRSFSDLRFTKWTFQPGLRIEIDENQTQQADSVTRTLMNYRASEFYLINGDSSSSIFRVAYQRRSDKSPQGGLLTDFLESDIVSANFFNRFKSGQLDANVNYRAVKDLLETGDVEEEVLNGRVNWLQNLFSKRIRSNFSFATGNSRELQREFVFLPVNTGQGTHTWRDTNEDGVQDLNEFFEAINPDERNFVKIFTPTDEYISAFQTFYLHTIDASLPTTWARAGGLKRFIGKLSLNVNFNTNFKTISSDYAKRLVPFNVKLSDPELLSSQDSKRYTLFFNRNRRGFAADVSYQEIDRKQLLSQGFENTERRRWDTNFKFDLSQ
ncbi:MAG: hypothetical protein AAF789_05315, partial [Bacteroidota bacterium]